MIAIETFDQTSAKQLADMAAQFVLRKLPSYSLVSVKASVKNPLKMTVDIHFSSRQSLTSDNADVVRKFFVFSVDKSGFAEVTHSASTADFKDVVVSATIQLKGKSATPEEHAFHKLHHLVGLQPTDLYRKVRLGRHVYEIIGVTVISGKIKIALRDVATDQQYSANDASEFMFV